MLELGTGRGREGEHVNWTLAALLLALIDIAALLAYTNRRYGQLFDVHLRWPYLWAAPSAVLNKRRCPNWERGRGIVRFDGQRYSQTLSLRPVPEEFARIYRRRGMAVPRGHSGHDAGAAIPYRYRHLHQMYAQWNHRFWMPCPLCGHEFGGHEICDVIPDAEDSSRGRMICPRCSAERNGGVA